MLSLTRYTVIIYCSTESYPRNLMKIKQGLFVSNIVRCSDAMRICQLLKLEHDALLAPRDRPESLGQETNRPALLAEQA